VTIEIPEYLTHYYVERPFLSITMLDSDERSRVLAEIATRRELKRRLRTAFYFEERLRFELLMRDQFVAKGGRPQLERPHYAILGESDVWAEITTCALRIPIASFSPDFISFTYTDSWVAYIDRDLSGNHLPRKAQYGTVYTVDELPDLFARYGWPGDRWKTEPEWEHDVYVEAQIWSIEALSEYLPNDGTSELSRITAG